MAATLSQFMSLWILVLISCGVTHGQNHPIVDTVYGSVRGNNHILHNGVSVNTFHAIPFAKPPVGELRFETPQEPDPWDDIFNATAIGDTCFQPLVSTIHGSHPGWIRYNEDCLHLNIFTPADTGEAPYPVMVWVHGGAYQMGGNIANAGHFLASYGVVVVTINYRLGNLGFTTTGDDVVPGSAGMLDQVQALRFVQDNIAAFGGDPDKVTIFGQSAGASSVGLHLVSPMSAGLFHQAILLSGTEMNVWSYNEPEQRPWEYTQKVAESLNCPTEPNQDMIDCLKGIGPRRLTNARFNCTDGYFCLLMTPVIDGHFLTDHPAAIRERGEHSKVPEIVGFTRQDANIFIPAVVRNVTNGITRDEYDAAFELIENLFSASIGDETILENMITALKFQYTYWPDIDDPMENSNNIGQAVTDIGFGSPAHSQAKLHSRDADTYFYLWTKREDNNGRDPWFGAYHAIELKFVFGDPFLSLNPSVFEETEFGSMGNFTDSDREFSDRIMTMWTDFAKYGNPTESNEELQWPKFAEGNLDYVVLGDDIDIRKDYRQREYAMWTEYLQYLRYGVPLMSNTGDLAYMDGNGFDVNGFIDYFGDMGSM